MIRLQRAQKRVLITLAVILAVLALFRVVAGRSVADAETSPGSILANSEPLIPVGLDHRTTVILQKLITCESGWNVNALNPKDKDGTASYSILQFKPGTLYAWVKQYGILPDIEPAEIMNVIWDPRIQIETAARAIEDNGRSVKWWSSQFPACAAHYHYFKDVL